MTTHPHQLNAMTGENAMGVAIKLTEKQTDRLIFIRDYVGRNGSIPFAGFWESSPTDRSLAARGLIEVADYTETLHGMKAIFKLARITEAGHATLSDIQEREKF